MKVVEKEEMEDAAIVEKAIDTVTETEAETAVAEEETMTAEIGTIITIEIEIEIITAIEVGKTARIEAGAAAQRDM